MSSYNTHTRSHFLSDSYALSLSHFIFKIYKIYLEIRHSFLNLLGPLLPIGMQGGHKSHLYIFIRNLFTRVLTILLAISHTNSNDPSSSASCDWPGGRSNRFELKRRARDTINPRRFLLTLRSFAQYRSSGHRGTTARCVSTISSPSIFTRFPEVARDKDRNRSPLDCYRLAREPKAFKDFQVLFSRGTARSRDRAQDKLFSLPTPSEDPLTKDRSSSMAEHMRHFSLN